MTRNSVSKMQELLNRLLSCAERLRRENARKWGFSLCDWRLAISQVLSELPQDDEDAAMAHRIGSAVRRLANSGEARFGSTSVGRAPGSSCAGRRFFDDLESLRDVYDDLANRNSGSGR